jgi:hypothetical protein
MDRVPLLATSRAALDLGKALLAFQRRPRLNCKQCWLDSTIEG